MLNNLSLLIIFSLMTACATKMTGDQQTDALITHLTKKEVYLDGQFDSKFEHEGLINGEYVAIGIEINPYHEDSAQYNKTKAEYKAIDSLLKSAPSAYQKIVQQSVSSLTNGKVNIDENSVMTTTVKALTGLKSNISDKKCVRVAKPNQDMNFTIVQECRAIVRVSATELNNAFSYTLQDMYGIKKEDISKKILENLMSNTSREVASN